MADKVMVLTFDWDGTVKKETSVFTGKKCTEQTKFIEEALSGKAKGQRKFKPEYYNTYDNENRLRVTS
jgi:hypothetical protein